MRKRLLALTTILFVFAVEYALPQSNASAPSLADAARQARKARKASPERTWTNDDFSTPVITAPPAAAVAGTAGAPPEAGAAAADAKPLGPVEKAVALRAAWKEKIDIQRKVIADLEAQSGKSSEELKQRSSAAYADLGVRLRNEQKFVADDTKIRTDEAKRQESLAAARAQLDQLLEEARKAGVEGSID